MADMVTKQELEAAKIDVKNAGEAVNTKKVITPRYGAAFKSLPLVSAEAQAKADEIVAQGFYRGYATEALLLAVKPTVSEMRARADDTRKIWRWNRTSAEGVTPVTGTWTDTGLSDKDVAATDATTKANAAEANAKNFTNSLINNSQDILYTLIDADISTPTSGSTNKIFTATTSKTAIIKVNPSTEYTIEKTESSRFRMIEFTVNPVVGTTLGFVTKSDDVSHVLHVDSFENTVEAFTFTTRADTQYIAVNIKTGTENIPLLQVKTGSVFDFTAGSMLFSKDAFFNGAKLSDAAQIKIGKNKFDGSYLQDVALSGAVDAANYNRQLSASVGGKIALIAIKPNTTYTISKTASPLLKVGLSKVKPIVGGSYITKCVVLFQDGTNTYTLTSGALDRYLIIYTGVGNAPSFMQVEESAVQTGWETYGYKIKNAAELVQDGIPDVVTGIVVKDGLYDYGQKIVESNHIIGYGQSLSLGAQGRPVLSIVQPYFNKKFVGGTRGNGDFSSLVPLVEDEISAQVPTHTGGETFLSGAANYAVMSAYRDNGVLPNKHVILGSTAGLGNTSINSLKKGTVQYQDYLLAQVAGGAALSSNYAVQAVAWAQGEKDIDASMNLVDYKALFDQFIIDSKKDIMATAGQSFEPAFISYQLSYAIRTKGNAVAESQYQAFKEGRAFLSCPTYRFTHYTGDGVHLVNNQYKLLGAYIGRVYKQLVVDKRRPDWLEPLSAYIANGKVCVRFKVPKLPLVLDSVNLRSTTNSGFVVSNGATNLTISNITINSDVVEITTTEALTGSIEVRYAYDVNGNNTITGGATGNLRDSSDEAVTIDSVQYQLFHVAPHFKMSVASLVI